jgi:hypothetical protein
MVWVRVDDDFPQHPKARKAGPVGMALWLAGLCYSSHYLTDGLVPVEVLSGLLPLEKKELTRTVDKLVFSGLWSVAEGGYEIHDYLDYQSSRTEVLTERERVRKWRENKKRTRTEPVRNDDAPGAVQRPTPTPIPSTKNKSPSGGRSASPPDPEMPSGFVGFYVDECKSRGYEPVRQWRDQIGNQSKRIAAEKPSEIIRSAIRIMADERKAPGILAHVIADIEAGRNGNGQSA